MMAKKKWWTAVNSQKIGLSNSTLIAEKEDTMPKIAISYLKKSLITKNLLKKPNRPDGIII